MYFGKLSERVRLYVPDIWSIIRAWKVNFFVILIHDITNDTVVTEKIKVLTRIRKAQTTPKFSYVNRYDVFRGI